MKLFIRRIIRGLYAIALFAACSNPGNKEVQTLDLQKIASRHSKNTFVGQSDIYGKQSLHISPKDGHNGIVIWEKGDKQDWSKANYLVFEVYGKETFSGVINIEFYKDIKDFTPEKIILQSGEISGTKEDTPWISSLMGILPRLKTQVVFPLSYIDAQRLFIPRSPRQLKGTISGNRLDPADVVKVVLRFGPYSDPYFLPEYELGSISLRDSIPETYPPLESPIIDELGQWKNKEWPGKLQDKEEMLARHHAIANETVLMPNDWSRYGGWKAKRFNASGFFKTHHDGKRWWLVDPEGYAFLSTGVDCITPNSSGPVTGIEDLFDWLPEIDDKVFGEARNSYRNRESMDFYVTNLIRIYGENWKDAWASSTENLIRKFRFNTIGNWSSLEFARKSKIPYVLQMRAFPATETLIYRDFPDVFAEEYKANSVTFAEQLINYRDDPYMVGYFLRNEPQWAFGYHNLAYEMFGTIQQSKTKEAFLTWLSKRYAHDIKALNKAWELELNSFDALRAMSFKSYPSNIADKDFYDFSTIMVKMYIDIPCDEVKRIDSKHLNLGMRYAWLSSDLLYKAGERFDVFSINGYGINPPPTEEIARISNKPIIIGEFHHGAVDRALPATGIIGVLNQDDRAKAYRNYIEQGFSRPELVGMHYFQWVDQPYYGRNDGENYNIGVVTSANLPYPELTKAMTITNERIYQVANGDIEPYKAELINIPPIHY